MSLLLHLLHLFSSLCANTAKRIKQLRIAAETAPELERSWIDDNDLKPNDLKELKKYLKVPTPHISELVK